MSPSVGHGPVTGHRVPLPAGGACVGAAATIDAGADDTARLTASHGGHQGGATVPAPDRPAQDRGSWEARGPEPPWS